MQVRKVGLLPGYMKSKNGTVPTLARGMNMGTGMVPLVTTVPLALAVEDLVSLACIADRLVLVAWGLVSLACAVDVGRLVLVAHLAQVARAHVSLDGVI